MEINTQAIELLKNSKNVAIFTHIKPDGDCLGSASAVKEALLVLGKQADIYCDSVVSENFNFIPHIENVNQKTVESYDLAVAVDCSDLNRLGEYDKLFLSIPNSLKIDHHKTQDNFAKVNVVELVSSTCLMLYYYLQKLTPINTNMATALYAGVSSDTGCFMHSNTGHEEHFVASELLKFPFDLEKANYYLFKRRTKKQVALTKIAYNNVQLLQNGKFALTTISEHEFKQTNTTKNDTLGLTEIVTNIEGVMVSAVLSEERKGLVACSFRSVGELDVSKIAEFFGGGGHFHASGCNIFGHLPTVVKKVEAQFVKLLNESK